MKDLLSLLYAVLFEISRVLSEKSLNVQKRNNYVTIKDIVNRLKSDEFESYNENRRYVLIIGRK